MVPHKLEIENTFIARLFKFLIQIILINNDFVFQALGDHEKEEFMHQELWKRDKFQVPWHTTVKYKRENDFLNVLFCHILQLLYFIVT